MLQADFVVGFVGCCMHEACPMPVGIKKEKESNQGFHVPVVFFLRLRLRNTKLHFWALLIIFVAQNLFAQTCYLEKKQITLQHWLLTRVTNSKHYSVAFPSQGLPAIFEPPCLGNRGRMIVGSRPRSGRIGKSGKTRHGLLPNDPRVQMQHLLPTLGQ